MLANTLQSIHNARETGQLFAALGYDRDDAPFGDDAWIVARWRGFRVIAADRSAAPTGVKALAHALEAAGWRALGCVVDPNRELALAAPHLGRSGITRVLTVSLERPTPESLHTLEDLRPAPESTGLAHAFRVCELLTAEGVGRRFFISFRMILERMAGSLDDRVPAGERRLLALLSLTRVLFLYFVQAKGWLSGRNNYLRLLLDEALADNRDFHTTTLQPLFFRTLNVPASARRSDPGPGKLPYLNGGLFEPHAVEREYRMPTFGNALWRDAFDKLFERFRFCVREAHEVNAIAPDMLGRVFERLMDRDERHASGTFYTPTHVVRQIVAASIETALAGAAGLTPLAARRVVRCKPLAKSERDAARSAVRGLRILDPAVGSGAFLLSALTTLTEIREFLEKENSTPVHRARLRREVLRENLFGVDLNPFAVRLAELRLWLAVIADDPTVDIEAVTPLPNLNGVVRQGDTLLDPMGAARASHVALPGVLATSASRAVRTTRERLFDATGPLRAIAISDLQVAERKLSRTLLSGALEATRVAVKDLASLARSRDLFGRRTKLSTSQRTRLRLLRQTCAELQDALIGLERGVVPFFSFDVHTPDIMRAGGFSAIIGNPPWVRAERLAPTRRRVLRDRFCWWRAGPGRGYRHLPDLAIAFLERSLELTATGGAVGLLLPSKVLSASYAETARQHVVRETSVMYAHRVPDVQAATFGATTYPLALVLKKSRPTANHRVTVGFEHSHAVRQASLEGSGPWILVPERAREALHALRRGGVPLGEIAPPRLGVKTGANDIMVGTRISTDGAFVTVQFGTETATIERSVVRRAIRGRDIRKFAVVTPNVLLWGYAADGTVLHSMPARASRYFRSHAAALERRSDYRKGPLWTLFRVPGVVAPHLVVWSDLAKFPRAAVLSETDAADAVPLNTCYVAAAPDRETALLITAVLNSTWARALALVLADEARGRYRRINARVTAQIPIPLEAPTASVVELSATAHARFTSQRDLDEVVANALGLDEETCATLRRVASNRGEPASQRS